MSISLLQLSLLAVLITVMVRQVVGTNNVRSPTNHIKTVGRNATVTENEASREVEEETFEVRCFDDESCDADEFCHGRREEKVCLPCRRLRRRCNRDSMCCKGNVCLNGICVRPRERVALEGRRHDNGEEREEEPQVEETTETADSRETFQDTKETFQRGSAWSRCLRSSDCQVGLCCARHWFSKVCKPMLTQGDACTRPDKRTVPGELFQRCPCEEELSCRPSRDVVVEGKPRLYTCQQ
uniref:Dickkopf-like protein 1 n=1 Tax=Branchiostoma belcheri TaxID=7741 RepID=E5FPT0_BRABE|nr:dickkopf-like protein 1 [Branchiostoma belcheri]